MQGRPRLTRDGPGLIMYSREAYPPANRGRLFLQNLFFPISGLEFCKTFRAKDPLLQHFAYLATRKMRSP